MHLFPCSFRAVALTQTPCIPMLDESIQTSLNITYILFRSSIDRPCLSLYKCRQHLYFKIARWFLSTPSSFHYFLLFNSKYWNIGNVITIRLFTKVDIGGFLSFLALPPLPPLARSLTVATTFLFPVFGLKWFCVDNFLYTDVLISWVEKLPTLPAIRHFICLFSPPYALYSCFAFVCFLDPFKRSLLLDGLTHFLIPIFLDFCGCWTGLWMTSLTWQPLVPNFIIVFYVSILILFLSPLHQCKMKYNFFLSFRVVRLKSELQIVAACNKLRRISVRWGP